MEITSKQRAYLRSLAAKLPPVFQIGKLGITDELITQLDLALEARELIKINVLKSADITPREAGAELYRPLRAQIVQCIGNKLVLYRESHKNKRIELKR